MPIPFIVLQIVFYALQKFSTLSPIFCFSVCLNNSEVIWVSLSYTFSLRPRFCLSHEPCNVHHTTKALNERFPLSLFSNLMIDTENTGPCKIALA